MNIEKNVLLNTYTTLRLGGKVSYLTHVYNDADIVSAVDFALEHGLNLFPLGGGSNIVVSDIVPQMLVLKMENVGIEIVENNEDVIISAQAGVVWDDFVAFTVSHGFSGVEALSAIPGTCGASPVQNIGAYGEEVGNSIESVRVYDTLKKVFRDISRDDCHFSYRDSVFKNELKRKCIIASVLYRLSKEAPHIPNYPRVPEEFQKMKTQFPLDPDIVLIRKAIQSIRSEKLPDPKQIANVGSFFKNPFVTIDTYEKLHQKFPDTPHFPVGEMIKIPAGWLIEKAGYKGYREHGVGTYEKNALVLVNISSTKTQNILDLANTIQKKVKDIFGISLEIEPEII